MDMESGRPERNINEAREIVYSKGKTMLPILLTSLCLALVALSILLWLPTSISYKNISSLSELNEDKVRFYTENQHIHLVYGVGEKQDTIRTVADYMYSLKKENLREEAIRTAEFFATEKEKVQRMETSTPKVSKTAAADPTIKENRFTLPPEELLAEGETRGAYSTQGEATIQPDEKPEFPKGARGLEVYLARNKRTPFPAKSKGIKGNVQLRFLVNADGSLSDIRIINGLGYGCDEEALRLVKNMPIWNPAVKDNRFVSCYENLSIRF